ncbi:MAG TPA: hypothetical protein VMT00_08670 [Thermoanaerobaculia bacterium]|nr:hypothetical protein [Thermoanaerobaculia bacterium]
MTCETFRSLIVSGEASPETLAHLRGCVNCVELAVEVDPENLFRSLGGTELMPAGGVDSFVDGVMQQLQLRKAEVVIGRGAAHSRLYRWAVAAVLVIGIGAAAFMSRPSGVVSVVTTDAAVERVMPVVESSRPVVESYEGAEATIIELPSDPASDMQIVMIFDESLPADL